MPTVTGDPMRNSFQYRLRRTARDAHRRVFCYSLALSIERSEQDGTESIAVRLAKSLPFADVARQQVRHRPGQRTIRASRLLMGSQAGLDSAGFAHAFGTLRFGSTPMDQSPHVQLLRLAASLDRPLSDEEIRSTPYFAFGRHLATIWGNYFGASSDDELVELSRNFIDWSRGIAPRVTGGSGSRFRDGVLVAKVSGASAFQVIDGHHRLAVAIAQGQTSVRVHRTWLSAETAVQRRLWERGYGPSWAKALAQPVAARELSDWSVATNCQDRLVRIERFVGHELGESPSPRSFLDVGCGYGWYLAELKRLGWRVRGVDRDGFGIEMATAFYGLDDDEIALGEWAVATESLEGASDVVACFDLGHAVADDHAASLRLLRALDARTAGILIVDGVCVGEGDAVGRLDAEELTKLVVDATSFTKVVDLGVNHDPPLPGMRAAATRLLAFTR